MIGALRLPRIGWAIGILLFANVLIETALQAADHGWDFDTSLRELAYQNGGFWPGLLQDWVPNYAAQPYTMWISYGFLHGGLLHLFMNMVTLWSLGLTIVQRVGALKFYVVYIGSILGGAAGYAALWTVPQPMVGASGALFGLAGAWLAWEYVDRFTARLGLWPVVRVVILLVALNAVMWWSLKGLLAWQTHLGGFVAGWVVAMLIDPRPRGLRPDADA